jgi:hypothetical protein
MLAITVLFPQSHPQTSRDIQDVESIAHALPIVSWVTTASRFPTAFINFRTNGREILRTVVVDTV